MGTAQGSEQSRAPSVPGTAWTGAGGEQTKNLNRQNPGKPRRGAAGDVGRDFGAAHFCFSAF